LISRRGAAHPHPPAEPPFQTTTLSLRLTRTTKHASMPALPVPETGNYAVSGAEGLSQEILRLVHDFKKGGIEMAQEREGKGPEHARGHVARAGAEQDSHGGLE
jgi:hypothetical protein